MIAALLGALGSDGPDIKLHIDMAGTNVSFNYAGQTILSTNGGVNTQLQALLVGSGVYIAVVAVV